MSNRPSSCGCASRWAWPPPGRGQLHLALEQLHAAVKVDARPLDRGRLYLHIASALATESRFEVAWDNIRQALAVLGAPFPDGPEAEGTLLQACMGQVAEADAASLPIEPAEKERATLLYQIYATASMAGLMTPGISPTRVPLLILLGRLTTMGLGVSREAASSETWYGLLLGLMGNKEASYRHAELSVTMAEQLGDPATLAYTRMYRAWTYEMAGDILLAEPMALEVEQEVIQYLGAWDYAQWAVTTGYQYVIRGYPHRAIQFLLGRLEQINQTGNLLMQTCAYLILYSQLTAVGRAVEGREFRREWQSLYDEEPQIPFLQACKFDHYMLATYELGDVDGAFEHAKAMLKYGPTDYWTWAMWLVIGYICRDRWDRAAPDHRATAQAEFEEALVRAQATSQPPVHKCHLSVLHAAAARLEGRFDDATPHLEAAITFADQADSPWGRFEASLERARLGRATGDALAERSYAQRALSVATEQGYIHRAQRVRDEFGLASTTTPRPAPTSRSLTRTTVRSSRRAEALLEVSVASASSLDLKVQARAALDAIVRELGAERGFLLVLEDGELELRAGRTAERTDLDTLHGHSSTIVQQVLDSGQGVVTTASDEGELLGSESAVVHNLRSMLAAPLKLQGRVMGVVYVDSRLIGGLFVEDDLDFLQGIGGHLAIALQTARMAQQETARVAMEKDLALTGSLQNLFLPPSQVIQQPGHFRIAAHYRPMTQCSGDFWWFDGHRRNPLLIVGDVTGHGAGAAMMAVSAMTFLRARSSDRGQDVDEYVLLSALDAYLHEVADSEMTIALCGVAFDPLHQEVRVLGAGALPLMQGTPGGELSILDLPASLPLGHGRGLPEAVRVPVSPGMRLLVFTDGLLEMPTARGRQLGLKGVRALFAQSLDHPFESCVETLRAQADALRGDVPLQDDLSFFVVAFE